jgi:hypothetical protein
VPQKLIHLKSPSVFMCADDLPNKKNYFMCCSYYNEEPATAPISRFKENFDRITAQLQLDEGIEKWENVILGAHGAGDWMQMYGNIKKDNIKTFAAPMRGKVKDIWLLSCSMGSSLAGVRAAELAAARAVKAEWLDEQRKKGDLLAAMTHWNNPDEVDWDLETNPYLAKAFEKIKPGSVQQLRNEWNAVGGQYSPSLRVQFCHDRWIDLNASAAFAKNTWVFGFAPILALETGANVWASPHIQEASKIKLNKGTLDLFEGDLYKFSPGKAAHIVSSRSLMSFGYYVSVTKNKRY